MNYIFKFYNPKTSTWLTEEIPKDQIRTFMRAIILLKKYPYVQLEQIEFNGQDISDEFCNNFNDQKYDPEFFKRAPADATRTA